MKTFCIINLKGGVGKTTTSVNLSAGIAELGYRTLLCDFDPQCDATGWLSEKDIGRETYEFLTGTRRLKSTVQNIGAKLDLLPGSPFLGSLVEISLASRLSGAPYDFCFMDTGPGLSALNQIVLGSADDLILPMLPDMLSVSGLSRMLTLIKRFSRLELAGVLLGSMDKTTNLSRDIEEQLRDRLSVFKTTIPRSVKFRECPQYHKNILQYAPGSPGALAFQNLSKEVGDSHA